ncbi:MAG: small multi-drug export protein [Dehalococcoidia bacterium]|nr:MAG: small multi-drug export protein [Dehalococcoidia bacterium]
MTSAQIIEVLVTAAAPISELRGAIPLGLTFTDNWPIIFLIAFIGNLLPVPFLLLFLGPVTDLLSKISIFKKIISFVFRISRRRGRIVEKYGAIGLTLFVAVPLPVTGAWTGSIVAFLLGMKFRKAFPAIVLGVFIAGIIVTSVAVVLDRSFFRD